MCDEIRSVLGGLDVDGLDGDLRWRTRTFGDAPSGGAPLGGEVLGGAEFAGAVLWGGAPGVAAPLSGRLPAPRVVLLLVVMTSP